MVRQLPDPIDHQIDHLLPDCVVGRLVARRVFLPGVDLLRMEQLAIRSVRTSSMSSGPRSMNTPRGTISPVLVPEKKVLNEPSMTPIRLFDRMLDRICLSASVRPHLFVRICSTVSVGPHLFDRMLERLCLSASVRRHLFVRICLSASVCPHLFDRICLSASIRPYLFVRICLSVSVRPHLFVRICSTVSVPRHARNSI
jgi:hypothetical protein